MWKNKDVILTDTPGLFDLKMPLPIWMSHYGQMTQDQKKVNKLLWVIRPTVRPNEEHRLQRDIIMDMFDNVQDFSTSVVVIFTFADKNSIDNPVEWLAELCDPNGQGKPVPRSIAFSKSSTQAELLPQILEGNVTREVMLKKDINYAKLFQENEQSNNTQNITFLIDQISEAKEALAGLKMSHLPQNIKNGAQSYV